MNARIIRDVLSLIVGLAIGTFATLVLIAVTGCEQTPPVIVPSKVAASPTKVAPVPPPVKELIDEHDGAPPMARKYRADLTRNARVVWGMDAPIAMFGAQVHQESSWNPDARSAYAAGLAQFTPATADWIDDAYPELGEAQPTNPAWALRALVRYDRHIFDRTAAATDCDRHAFTLSGYNGGPGWVTRDRARAATQGIDAMRYWDAVERVNAGRRADMFAENRGYPKRIIRTLQPKYATWGREVCV